MTPLPPTAEPEDAGITEQRLAESRSLERRLSRPEDDGPGAPPSGWAQLDLTALLARPADQPGAPLPEAVDAAPVDPDRVDPDRVDPDRVDPDRVDPDRVDPDRVGLAAAGSGQPAPEPSPDDLEASSDDASAADPLESEGVSEAYLEADDPWAAYLVAQGLCREDEVPAAEAPPEPDRAPTANRPAPASSAAPDAEIDPPGAPVGLSLPWVTGQTGRWLLRSQRQELDIFSTLVLEKSLRMALAIQLHRLHARSLAHLGAPGPALSAKDAVAQACAALDLWVPPAAVRAQVPAARRSPQPLSQTELVRLHTQLMEPLKQLAHHPAEPDRWLKQGPGAAAKARAGQASQTLPALPTAPGLMGLNPEYDGDGRGWGALGPDRQVPLLRFHGALHLLDLRTPHASEHPHERLWSALAYQLHLTERQYGDLGIEWIVVHRPLVGRVHMIRRRELPVRAWPRGRAADASVLGPEHLASDPVLCLHLVNGLAKTQTTRSPLRDHVYQLKDQALARLLREGQVQIVGTDPARPNFRTVIEGRTALGVRQFHSARDGVPRPLTPPASPCWGHERLLRSSQQPSLTLTARLGADTALMLLQRWLG